MSPLYSFLIEASKQIGNIEVHLTGRLKDQTFVIKGLTLEEISETRKRSIRPELTGTDRIDAIEVTKQTIISGCVEPDFKNAEFIKACGCMTPSELIDKVLLAGEANQLAAKIMDASGYDSDINKVREEAKN